jgi:DUF1365 family protein
MAKPWLYSAKIWHARYQPHEHSFSYDGFFICFPLREKATLKSKFFSVNRFNIFSYHDKDHGDGGELIAFLTGLCATRPLATDYVEILTMPRVLGYVFNPVSFIFFYNQHRDLMQVICEVNNTFGERHYYYLASEDNQKISEETELHTQKLLHVSPFFPVSGEYTFNFRITPSKKNICIDYYDNTILQLKTSLNGQAQILSDNSLFKTLLHLGWATLGVVIKIHWQAIKLWRKKTHFFHKPIPPKERVS